MMDQSPLTILTIDDDEADIKQFKHVLKQSGLSCECISVFSIQDALIACNQYTFDCIFIDYLLTQENGLEGISILHSQHPFIPLIMLTGRGDETVATEAMKLSAVDYMVKVNLTPELLKKSLLNALEIIQMNKQVEAQKNKLDRMAHYDYLTEIP